jgi:hypothetical protein
MEAARTWSPCLQVFITRTFELLRREIMGKLDSSFGHIKNTMVYKESRRHMSAFVQRLQDDLSSQLRLIYDLECSRLFTKDDDTQKRHKANEYKILARHRHHFRWAAHIGVDDPGALPKMEQLTEDELKTEAARMEKEAAKMDRDPFEQELDVAAYVRGYYLTAANRFTDTVALHIMSGLFPRVSSVIDTYLHKELGLLDGPNSKQAICPWALFLRTS